MATCAKCGQDASGTVIYTSGMAYHPQCLPGVDSHYSDRATIARLESELAEAREWEDAQDSWSHAIHLALPTRSGSHEEYGIATTMVSARRSKGSLVALVNWLLVERNAAQALAESRGRRVEELEMALRALYDGTRGVSTRGLGSSWAAEYEMPPSTNKAVRKLIAEALSSAAPPPSPSLGQRIGAAVDALPATSEEDEKVVDKLVAKNTGKGRPLARKEPAK